MALAVIFDVSERIDDFVSRQAPIKAILFEYYLNFVFYYSNLFSGLIIFIAVIFFTSKMASNTEIVAILTGGISFGRMLYPYFIAATILTVGSLYMNHWVIPDANKKRLNFEEVYIRNKFYYADRNTHVTISENERVYFESFNASSNMGFKFSMEQYDGNQLIYKLNAKTFLWDTVKTKWVLRNYQERFIEGKNETLKKGWQKDTSLSFTPADFKRRTNIVSAMNYSEITQFIEEEKEKGSDEIVFYELEKHQRTSYPFSTYVLTLIGAVIASKKVRGGIGLHLAMGIFICLIYILFIKTTTVMATNAGLDPAIAVWIPNVFFAFVGYILYRRAQK